MKADNRTPAAILAGGILLAGLVPLVLYPVWFGTGGNAGELGAVAFRATSVFEQWMLLLTAVAVKPAYILITTLLVIWLWRQQAPDLVALRRGLIAFWLGENACTINFLLYQGNCELWEYLHNFGMVVSFSFITYALLEGLDRRLLKYSAAQDRCAALSLCRACIKYEDVPCGLRRAFNVFIPATMVLALMPFCARIENVAYDTSVIGRIQHFMQSIPRQLFELRYCPVLALALLGAAWFVLVFKKPDPVPLAKALFAAGLGPLGFGMMRLFLFAAYRDDLAWFMAWEELTEFLFIVAVAFVLFIFRQSLLPRRAVA
jgi:hypothetical protein